MIKAVLFDMDGVLIDTEVTYRYRLEEFCKKYHYPYTMEGLDRLVGCSHEMGIQLIKEMVNGLVTPEKFWEQWNQSLIDEPIDYLRIRVDGAMEVMEYLKANGYRIGLCSATEKEKIISEMQEAELFGYFDAITSGHEVARSKPYPDVYLETIKRLQIEAEECIVVEDSTYGITAAKAAGVSYVFARYVSELIIDQREADEVIDHLTDIIPFLER